MSWKYCDNNSYPNTKKDIFEVEANLFSSQQAATLNLCLIYFEITWALAILLEHMHKKFEINRTKIKGGCQSGKKVVTHNSKRDLPLNTCTGWFMTTLKRVLFIFWSLKNFARRDTDTVTRILHYSLLKIVVLDVLLTEWLEKVLRQYLLSKLL